MNLPNSEYAYVPHEKLSQYLLSESHPAGRSKARFFRRMGYPEDAPAILERDLLSIAQREEISKVVESVHGMKYIVDGSVTSPNGAFIHLRTIWIIEEASQTPRFVTAYPASSARRNTGNGT